jgi:hypothetical protein
MVHVPNRPYIHMRLRPLKLALGHNFFLVVGGYRIF